MRKIFLSLIVIITIFLSLFNQPTFAFSKSVSTTLSSERTGVDKDIKSKDLLTQIRYNKTNQISVDNAKAKLVKYIDSAIRRLTNLKNKISGTDKLDSQTKDNYLQTIDEYLDWLTVKKQDISKAQTIENLLEIVSQMKTKRQDFQAYKNKQLAKIFSTRTSIFIEKLDSLKVRLAKIIDDQKKQGKDTSFYESKITQIQNNLSQAKNNLNTAIQNDDLQMIKNTISLLKGTFVLIKELSQNIK